MKEILERFRQFINEGPYHERGSVDVAEIKRIMEEHLNRQVDITRHAEHKMRDMREWTARGEEGDKYDYEWERKKDDIMSNPDNRVGDNISPTWKKYGRKLDPITVRHTFSTLVNKTRNPNKRRDFDNMLTLGNKKATIYDNDTNIAYVFGKPEINEHNGYVLLSVIPFKDIDDSYNTIEIN